MQRYARRPRWFSSAAPLRGAPIFPRTEVPLAGLVDAVAAQAVAAFAAGQVGSTAPPPRASAHVVASKRGLPGDYQTGVAMELAKAQSKGSGASAKPGAVAEALATHIRAAACSGDAPLLSQVSTAASSDSPFLNLRVSDAYLAGAVAGLAAAGGFAPVPPPLSPAALPRVLIDFGSPNMGKELHVGHMRSGIIGDSLARVLEFGGARGCLPGCPPTRVDRVSHVGDSGLPVALVLTWYLGALLQPAGATTLPPPPAWVTAPGGVSDEDGSASSFSLPPAKELSSVYARVKAAVEAEKGNAGAAGSGVSLGALAGQVLSALQSALAAPQDLPPLPTAAAATTFSPALVYRAWQRMCEASRRGFNPLFASLGVDVTERGEASYVPLLEPMVAALLASGVAEHTEGAVGVFVDGRDKPPLLLRKGDGTHLYATIDMAALRWRLASGAYDRLIYVTDGAQAHHFRQLFAAARAAGWVDPATGANMLHPDRKPVSLEHVAFGVITGPDGKKLSSRDGVEATLADLLEQAVAAASAEASPGADASTIAALAHGAVRYFDLAHNRRNPYKYSPATVLGLKGNTGPYLLYGVTRLSAIRRKAGGGGGSNEAPSWEALVAAASVGGVAPPPPAAPLAPQERQLALTALRFPEAFQATSRTLLPNLLAEYAYELATDFHAFYEACPVLGAKEEVVVAQRLRLCQLTDATLRTCCDLLGLPIVERM